VSPGYETIRSYQRIFRPERRIYQLEGHALPLPGGVPLRWLAYASAALAAVLALGSGSVVVLAFVAITASVAGLVVGGRRGALAAGIASLGAAWLAGFFLGLLDWPLRLIVVPVAVATLATQVTPDGRRADRFAASWLALRLAPGRRSLDRALPALGVAQLNEGELWVSPDEHSPDLRRARVRGPATVSFRAPIALRRAALRRGRVVAGSAGQRGDESAGARLALSEGELLEVRP